MTNRSAGKLAWLCALAITAALHGTDARGQAPVTQVSPVASPEAMASASPEAMASPVASPTAAPSPVASGTAPMATGTAAAVSGTVATATPSPTPPNPYSIEIDLEEQRIYLLKDGKKIADGPISSGRAGHLTPTGDFQVIQKDLNHLSTLYGKIVEKGSGRVVKAGADAAMPVPKGCVFVPAPMKWFMRFDGATGMHAGILPGYPASHGCVRMPAAKAELFYNTVELGTPVHVFGTAPVRAIHEEEPPPKHVAAAEKPSPTPKPPPRPPHWWHF